MSDRSALTENQLKVKKYFDKYNIEETISDLLNTLAHSQDEKPLLFMVKYLANLLPKEELESAGITINPPNPSPSQILAITYPEFDLLCNNLFKTYLTKEMFLNIKNKKTPKFNNTIRPLIQAALENQNSKIGCYLPDSEAFEVFQGVIGPIVEELNQGVNIKGFKYQRDCGLKGMKETKLTTELGFIRTYKVKVKRNIDGFGFNLSNSIENKKKIRENLLNALNKTGLFQKELLLEDMNEEEKKKFWVNNKGFFNIKKNPFVKQGVRYRDWPIGRAIAITIDKR